MENEIHNEAQVDDMDTPHMDEPRMNTRVDHRMHDRMEEMREQASMVGHGIQGMAHTASAAATDQLEPMRDYVREQPIKSLMIAAGVGAVLGLLMFRR